MPRSTERILDKLMVVAYGDPLLVQDALRMAGPDLENIVAYILARRAA